MSSTTTYAKLGIKGWYSRDYHYSRHNSGRFWKRVKAVKNDALHREIYEAGVRLQNLEHQVLEKLKKAERGE